MAPRSRPVTPHDHGDVAVHRALVNIGRDCDAVLSDLARLRDLLRGGAGDPVPGELTPDEFQYLSATLTRVGLAGHRLLRADAAQTDAREGGTSRPQ